MSYQALEKSGELEGNHYESSRVLKNRQHLHRIPTNSSTIPVNPYQEKQKTVKKLHTDAQRIPKTS